MSISVSNFNSSQFDSALLESLEAEVLRILTSPSSRYTHVTFTSVEAAPADGVGSNVNAILNVESPVTSLDFNDLLILLLDEQEDDGFGAFSVSDVSFATGVTSRKNTSRK